MRSSAARQAFPGPLPSPCVVGQLAAQRVLDDARHVLGEPLTQHGAQQLGGGAVHLGRCARSARMRPDCRLALSATTGLWEPFVLSTTPLMNEAPEVNTDSLLGSCCTMSTTASSSASVCAEAASVLAAAASATRCGGRFGGCDRGLDLDGFSGAFSDGRRRRLRCRLWRLAHRAREGATLARQRPAPGSVGRSGSTRGSLRTAVARTPLLGALVGFRPRWLGDDGGLGVGCRR